MAETVSIPGVFGRLRDAEQRAGVQPASEPWLGFALYLMSRAIVPFEVAYAQQHPNGVWQSTAVRSGTTLT